jgi:hypothetical protein
MRLVGAVVLSAIAAPSFAADEPALAALPQATFTIPSYVPLTPEERWRDYVRRSYSPRSLGIRIGRNGLPNLWSNNPPEWGQGVDGYGKRVAADSARSWIRRGVESGGAYLVGQDPRYIPCPCKGPWKRMGHAFAQSFLAYDNDGDLAFGYARVGSRYASSMVEMSWYPERYGWKDGMREATQSFVSAGLFNIAREFWPDIRVKLRRKKK